MPLKLQERLKSNFYQRLEGSQTREFSESVSFFHLVVSEPKNRPLISRFFFLQSFEEKMKVHIKREGETEIELEL